MSAIAEQTRAAYLAGRLAARAGRPVGSCPYNPDTQQQLSVWFVRGWRSITADSAGTTPPDDGQQAEE
jgi:ribosome modulation factor